MTSALATPRAGGLVCLASYPKSGNTWFRVLRSNLRAGRNDPVDINALNDNAQVLTRREILDGLTLIESGMLTPAEIDVVRPSVYRAIAEAAAPCRPWVKIHEKWRSAADGRPLFGPEAVSAAVYLVRDPRDVAVSLAHHEGVGVDEAIDHLNSPDYALCHSNGRQLPQLREELGDWSTHVTGWLDQSAVPVHLIRYEDLKANTAERFACALRFLGESFSAEDVERAVRLSAFPELQKQEQACGFREKDARTLRFFRRGEVGAWRDELTPAQAERIVEAHAPVMRRLGYLAT